MKSQFLRVLWMVAGAFVVTCWSGCTDSHAENEVSVPVLAADAAPEFSTAGEENELAQVPESPNLSDDPPTTISSSATNEIKVVKQVTPPENLKSSPVVQEIIRLAEAGVNDEVILAYVTNSTKTYQLNSDEILYLNDLGLSGEVITAMLQRGGTPELVPVAPTAPSAGLPLTNPPSQVAVTAPSAAQSPALEAPLIPPEETVTSTTTFYNSLSPYGTWVEEPDYGLVWQPTVVVVNPGWRPYCDRGRWVWTDCGWYWYSDYSWGWAPFHYGRWSPHVRLGWVWVPDTFWGPSWVSWRHSGDYCGWAPLPPIARFQVGIGLRWDHEDRLGRRAYTFVPANRFNYRNPRQYALPVRQTTAIYNQSTVVNNYGMGSGNRVINRGFGKEPIVRASGVDIQTVAVRQATTAPFGGRGEQFANNGSTIVAAKPPMQHHEGMRNSLQATRLAAFTPTPASPGAVPSLNSRSFPGDSGGGRTAAKPLAVAKGDAPQLPRTPAKQSWTGSALQDNQQAPSALEARTSGDMPRSPAAAPPGSIIMRGPLKPSANRSQASGIPSWVTSSASQPGAVPPRQSGEVGVPRNEPGISAATRAAPYVPHVTAGRPAAVAPGVGAPPAFSSGSQGGVGRSTPPRSSSPGTLESARSSIAPAVQIPTARSSASVPAYTPSPSAVPRVASPPPSISGSARSSVSNGGHNRGNDK